MSAPSGSLARAGSAAESGGPAAPAPDRAPEAGACTLSNDLGWALGAVFRGYVKAAHEALASLPGGPRGYQVLAAGLIERRPEPADRRARRIVATPHGQGTLTGLDQRLRAAEEQLLSGLDAEEDRQAFRRLLRRLAVHASGSDPGRPPCGADGTQGRQPVLPC